MPKITLQFSSSIKSSRLEINISHPKPLWLLGLSSLTVRTLFNNKIWFLGSRF
ncbi:hypothetical protein HYE36_04400 [Mycoplasmopsis bovis]|nr:hypothetical protein [Mycoplasmopsis bovis]QQH49079.1 hypothetical protein HYD74_00370 [Mycoplasmopsis bovis]WHL49122.1 hypothetical protein HYE36_04400 [Mycoplasmopsis bovis]